MQAANFGAVVERTVLAHGIRPPSCPLIQLVRMKLLQQSQDLPANRQHVDVRLSAGKYLHLTLRSEITYQFISATETKAISVFHRAMTLTPETPKIPKLHVIGDLISMRRTSKRKKQKQKNFYTSITVYIRIQGVST